MNHGMLVAFSVSLIAGLATVLGGLLATHPRMKDRAYIAVALAFAAGAMVFVSLVQVIPTGILLLDNITDAKTARAAVYAAFFAGILLVLAIDRLLPKGLNPNEIEGKENEAKPSKRLLRSGFLVAGVLALHNFPEGLSTFVASYQDLSLGLTLAIAIGVHNIPEGIAVAAPLYAATGSRRKAVMWALISGLTEPLGALAAIALIIMAFPADILGVLFGLVAGMMVFISLDELLPAARRYQTRPHQSIYGMFGGMLIVALSILLMSS